jgi:Terpene cyclase DEP1
VTTADQADQASSIPTSRKVLCVVYGAIAVAALFATWSQNLAYFDKPARFLLDFLNDSKVTAASRSLTVDILLFFLAAAVLMVIEARKHGVKFVWLYIAGGFAIAISVTFPLFLIARELRMGTSDAPRLHTTDTILLAVVGVLIAGLTIWVDMG